jgi:hypothetical protein
MIRTTHFTESKIFAYFEIHTVNTDVLIGEPKGSSPVILKITLTYDTKPVPSTFPPHFQSPQNPSYLLNSSCVTQSLSVPISELAVGHISDPVPSTSLVPVCLTFIPQIN